MKGKSIERRLSALEATAGVTDKATELKDWIEFLEQIMPEGADWDLEAEARLLLDKGARLGSIFKQATKVTPHTLPNLCQEKLETPKLPPSQWCW